jgi:hypothetical protein
MRPQPLFGPRWVILALLTGASILPHSVRLLLAKPETNRSEGGESEIDWRRRLAAVGVLARLRLWRARRMFELLGSPS